MSLLLVAAVIDLTWFDQEKLAQSIEQMPLHVRIREEEVIDTPRRGVKVTNIFPDDQNGPFQVRCESLYFNQSSYATSAVCSLSLDLDHPELEKVNDEFQTRIYDDYALALHQVIPYGRPNRQMRSTHKEEGITSSGKKGNVFDYNFSCSQTKER